MSKKKCFLFLSIVLLAMAIICGVYLTTGGYQSNVKTASALLSTADYSVQQSADGSMAFVPSNPKAGLIFYPGGKIDSQAYAPLMRAFAGEDILCVLLTMPFDLAIFDVNAADGIQDRYPEIEQWYLAGHSLGGAMAANYAANHADEYEGLFLLASYSVEDLTSTDLHVVSLYGSEDRVLNMEQYQKYHSNLPGDAVEVVIPGGCHAYFGNYGSQDGDGVPTITNEDQIQITVAQCMSIIEQ